MHAPILKGIVGFAFTVLQRSFKVKQQKQFRRLQCQEQSIDHVPYYLSGLSRAHFFPTTFLEIAVY